MSELFELVAEVAKRHQGFLRGEHPLGVACRSCGAGPGEEGQLCEEEALARAYDREMEARLASEREGDAP